MAPPVGPQDPKPGTVSPLPLARAAPTIAGMVIRLAVLATAIALLQAGEAHLLAPASSATLQRGNERIACVDARAALAQAVAGDVVLLGPGTHRGPLLIDKAGLTLRGEPGARIDAGSTAWTPVWTPEPACGPDAYASPIPFEPAMLTVDGRGMIDVRESRGGLAVHALGVGRAGRGALGTIFTWQAKTGRVVVSFAGADHPGRHRIVAIPAGTVAVAVRGVDACSVEGLIVTGGHDGVLLEGTRGSTVRGCLVYACDIGIRIGPGSTGCKVLGNDVTLHADGLNSNCDLESGLAGDDVWGAHKNFGTYDKTGIAADNAGAGNEIAGNWLYDVWDGIENGNDVGKSGIRAHVERLQGGAVAEANRDLSVHHNRIDLTMDDALSPGNDQMGHRWYANTVTRARCAVRFKTPDIGPFHFFDNILVDNSDGLRLYKSAPACATVVIHNNLVIHPDGVIYHKMESVAWDDPGLAAMPRGTPGFHIYSNIFVSERQFTNQGADVPPNFIADRNLFTCARSPMPALQARDRDSLFAVQPQFTDPAAGDWSLRPGSPGAGAGLPFAQFAIPAALPIGWNVPAQPDIGLLHIEPGLTPRGPATALWALAAAELGLGERRVEDAVIAVDRWQLLGQGSFALEGRDGTAISRIDLLRAADRSTGSWKVEALAPDGSPLGQVAGGPPGLQLVSLRLGQPVTGRITLRVQDESVSRWRIAPAAGQRVGIVGAAKLRLAKYDGGAYALEVEQPAGNPGFAVALRRDFAEGVCAAVVIHPDGRREDVPTAGLVATAGLGGIYRVQLSFTKRAELDWPIGQVLWLPAVQEHVALRSRWPKPAF